MNEYELFNAVTEIDDGYIKEAERICSARRERRRLVKALAAAACLAAVLSFAAYSVPRLLSNGSDSSPAAADAPKDITVWNEGELPSPAMRGGSAVRSYSTASESFEYWGDFALPEELGGDITLKEDETTIYSFEPVNAASETQITINCAGEYSYSAPSDGGELHLYVCGVERTDPVSGNTVYTITPASVYSSYSGATFLLSISNDESSGSDNVYYAQVVLNSPTAPKDTEGARQRLLITIESVGNISRTRFLDAVKRLLDSL